MYIISEDSFYNLKQAADNLTSGSLLLQKDGDEIWFSTDRIYCSDAGYMTNWSNFIGYQHTHFYAYIKQLEYIADCDDYLLDDSESMICEQINKVIGQSKILYDKVKGINSHEKLTSILKQELSAALPLLYAELLHLKALLEPEYISDFVFNNKRVLSSENILRTWQEHVVG